MKASCIEEVMSADCKVRQWYIVGEHNQKLKELHMFFFSKYIWLCNADCFLNYSRFQSIQNNVEIMQIQPTKIFLSTKTSSLHHMFKKKNLSCIFSFLQIRPTGFQVGLSQLDLHCFGIDKYDNYIFSTEDRGKKNRCQQKD